MLLGAVSVCFDFGFGLFSLWVLLFCFRFGVVWLVVWLVVCVSVFIWCLLFVVFVVLWFGRVCQGVSFTRGLLGFVMLLLCICGDVFVFVVMCLFGCVVLCCIVLLVSLAVSSYFVWLFSSGLGVSFFVWYLAYGVCCVCSGLSGLFAGLSLGVFIWFRCFGM